MPRGRGAPERGEVYSIDPNPTKGRELAGRHYWLILTPLALNQHGMAMAVAISTGAQGMRKAGLAVSVQAGKVTGVAVLNQVRSFDIRERVGLGEVTYEGTAETAIVDDIAERIASLIAPDEPETPAASRERGKAEPAGGPVSETVGTLGEALKEARARGSKRRK